MPKASRKKYWADIAYNGFTDSSVIFPVCVRSPGVRGRNLEATLENLSNSGVKHLYVILCDTLDRWNLDTVSPEDTALKAADHWYEKHAGVLKSFCSIETKRWNDVRADGAFPAKLDLITRLYKSVSPVKTAVDEIANFYLFSKERRCRETGIAFEPVKERSRSTFYLLEEFAGTAVYASWFPGVPEAYWGVYVGDHTLFQRLNTVDPSIDLTLPRTLPVQLNRLPAPVAGGFSSLTAA